MISSFSAAMIGYRSSGSRDIARASMASTWTDTSGRRLRTGGGSTLAFLLKTAITSAPL